MSDTGLSLWCVPGTSSDLNAIGTRPPKPGSVRLECAETVALLPCSADAVHHNTHDECAAQGNDIFVELRAWVDSKNLSLQRFN